MRTEQSVMLSIAETQSSLKTLLTRLADAGQDAGLDKASKGHIRNIDLRLERLSSDLAHGRDSTVEELRSEIRLLTRPLAALAEEGCRTMHYLLHSRPSINLCPGLRAAPPHPTQVATSIGR